MNGSNGNTNNSRPLDSYGALHKKMNAKTTPNAWKRGIISAIHVAANTADVTILGNNSSTMRNVPLSSAVDVNAVKIGDKCRLDMFDETNPNDCVVAYTYGTAAGAKTNSGYASVSGSVTHHAIPHNLPGIPTLISISTWPGGVSAGGGEPAFVWVSLTAPPADETNIYVDAFTTGTKSFYWAATIV